MLALWRRLPVILRAIITGGALGAFGTSTWSALAAANLRVLPVVPWAMVPTALVLWLYWRYASGWGWPRATAGARRTNLRANRISDDVWGGALLAGFLGIVCVLLFQRVMVRLVHLPQQDTSDVAHLPFLTLAGLLITSAVVSGVVEESAFRGYLQRPIEQRFGPVVAILVTGSLFGLAHFSHPEVTIVLLPFYLAVAAVYGTLAWLTDSIYPGLVLHAGGNMLGSIALFTGGPSEWQSSASPQPLIWQSGADAAFWMALLAFAVSLTLTVAAFVSLARQTRAVRSGATTPES